MSKEEKIDNLMTEDGSAISLGKITEKLDTKEFTLLVNSSGQGIRNDIPMMEINSDVTKEQAKWFMGTFYRGHGNAPEYLKKYMNLWWNERSNGNKISDIDTLIDNALDSNEVLHCIGFIQLLAGSLNAAKKAGKGIRLYIVEPETHLHPSRQSAVVCVMQQIKEDYGFGDVKTKTKTKKK